MHSKAVVPLRCDGLLLHKPLKAKDSHAPSSHKCTQHKKILPLFSTAVNVAPSYLLIASSATSAELNLCNKSHAIYISDQLDQILVIIYANTSII